MKQTKRLHFTKKVVEALTYDASGLSKETEYSDTECIGLKAVVTAQGRKFWYYRYTFKKRRRCIKIGEISATSLIEARQRANAYRAQIDRGEDPQANKLASEPEVSIPTLSAFVKQEYLPTVYKTKRSAKDDDSRLRHHVLDKLGSKPLDRITRRDVQQLLADVKSARSAGTHNRVLSLLHRVFSLAVEWEFLPEGHRNPVAGARKLPEVQRTRYLSQDEMKRFLTALRNQSRRRAAALFEVALLTGARIGEVRKMRWIDLSLGGDKPTWHIPHTKSGRSRTIMLAKRAAELLSGLERKEGSPFVFAGRDPSKPMVVPQALFEKVLQEAEIADFRVHDLRHSWASWAAMSGAPMRALQASLGHQEIGMTQRYSHLSDESLRQAQESVASVFDAAVGD